MKPYFVKIDGEDVEVLAQKVGGVIWFHYDGVTYSHSPETHQRASGQGDSLSDPKIISAPMPGKILKIFKNVGETVSEGETLVVMEAMKMEYNLKAIKNMMVREVKFTEGATVGLGEVIVEMEEN